MNAADVNQGPKLQTKITRTMIDAAVQSQIDASVSAVLKTVVATRVPNVLAGTSATVRVVRKDELPDVLTDLQTVRRAATITDRIDANATVV